MENTLNGVYGHQSAVEIFLFIDPEAEHKWGFYEAVWRLCPLHIPIPSLKALSISGGKAHIHIVFISSTWSKYGKE